MVIKFKKIRTISDKVYISFDNGVSFFEYNVEDLCPSDNEKAPHAILFGKTTPEEEKAYIEFFKNDGNGILHIECDATPESLSDIKIFAKSSDEVWTPSFSSQREVTYENETDKTIYINYEQSPDAFKSYLDSDFFKSENDIKLYNMFSSVGENRFDMADEVKRTLESSGKYLNMQSSVLPPRKSYNDFFKENKNLRYGLEVSDYTETADGMYENSSIKYPISLAGNLKSAKNIFRNTRIQSMPKHFGNKLEDISGAFSLCTSLPADISNIALPDSILNMSRTFEGTNIEKAPPIPKHAENFTFTFANSNLKVLPEFWNFDDINLTSTFYGCRNLGVGGDEVKGLPNGVLSLNKAFSCCTEIEYFAESLPSHLVEAQYTFAGCKKLKNAPSIPVGTKDITGIFNDCTSLSFSDGTVFNVPFTVEKMDDSFNGTGIKMTPQLNDATRLSSIERAFFNCPNLTFVNDINVLAPIKSFISAFDGKSKIERFPDLPQSCEDDLSWAFSVGISDKSLNNSNSIKSFGEIFGNVSGIEGMFYGASNLEDISLIQLSKFGIESINSAFENCSKISTAPSISIINSTPTAKSLFKNCVNLNKISKFPRASSFESAFEGCTSLTGAGISDYSETNELEVGDQLPTYFETDEEDIYVDVKDMFKGCSSLKEIVFPRLAKNATKISEVLESVEIISKLPENETTQDVRDIFSLFPNVKIVEEVPNIENLSSWFKDKKNLISVGIRSDNKVTSLEDTFSGCENLINTKKIDYVRQRVANKNDKDFTVEIPKSAINIKNAFKGCSKITKISEIPASIIVAESAFENCSSLSVIEKFSSNGDFRNAFVNSGVETINEIFAEDTCNSVKFGNAGLSSLKKVDFVNAKYIEGLFENCVSLKSALLSQNTANMNFTFKNCSSLSEIAFEDGLGVPNSVETLNSAFENSGITIDSTNYQDFFSADFKLKSLDSTFRNCQNIKYTPIFSDESREKSIIFNNTFRDCLNLENVSLNSNVTYNNAFDRCVNIKVCETVPKSVKLTSSTFKDCPNLKTIKKLEYNPCFTTSATKGAASAKSIVTELGESFDAIKDIEESQNSTTISLSEDTEASLRLTMSKLEDEFTDKGVEVNFGDISTEVNAAGSVFHKVDMTIKTPTIVPEYLSLKEYIDWLFDEGYISSTKYLDESAVFGNVTSYSSHLGEIFPNVDTVEQITASNATGILAKGRKILANESNVFLDYEKEHIGPSIKKVTGAEVDGEMYIASTDVTNLSYAFFENDSIESIGNIPDWVTGFESPFIGCSSLKEIGNIYPNSTSYAEICSGLTSLVSVGNIGKDGSLTSVIDGMFEKCGSLQNVGKISSSIYSFKNTFSGCTSLKNIEMLSYSSLKQAVDNSVSNISGMFFQTPENLTIVTESEETKSIFKEYAHKLKNKVSTKNNGEEYFVEREYTEEECQAWVDSITFIIN